MFFTFPPTTKFLQYSFYVQYVILIPKSKVQNIEMFFGLSK
jgi:hypothetical protein